MNIAYFLTPKDKTAFLYDDYSIRQGLEKMKFHGYSVIPVIDRNGKYIGTISEGDFLWLIVTGEGNDVENKDVRELEDLKIKDIITSKKYQVANVTKDVYELIELSMSQNFVPVVDDRYYFIGIVTRQNIIKHLYNKIKQS